MRNLLMMAIISLFVTGCGQKGDLTLPSDIPANTPAKEALKPHIPDIISPRSSSKTAPPKDNN